MVEWATLDAQWFGVAQRRRRVFAVADFGDWARRPPVLLERQGLRGDSPPSREEGQGAAGTLAGGSRKRGGFSYDDVPAVGLPRPLLTHEVTSAIDASFARLQGCSGQDANHGHSHLLAFGGNNTSGPIAAAAAVNAKGGAGRMDFESETFIVFDTTQITSPANRSNPRSGDPCHPLAAGAHAPAIAFDCKASGRAGFGVGDVASTMRSMGAAGSHQNGGGHLAVAVTGDVAHALNTANNGKGCSEDGTGRGVPTVATGMKVRRLTPRECERLQGMADDHTQVQHRGKPAADGPRYKALGNSMAVPVMKWIGQQIDFVHNFF